MRNPSMPDLFDQLQYPVDPGYRPTDTSHQAAKKVRGRAQLYEQAVLNALADYGPMTSHELARVTGYGYGQVQPATARLRAKSKLHDSGLRGLTPEGNNCIKWEVL